MSRISSVMYEQPMNYGSGGDRSLGSGYGSGGDHHWGYGSGGDRSLGSGYGSGATVHWDRLRQRRRPFTGIRLLQRRRPSSLDYGSAATTTDQATAAAATVHWDQATAVGSGGVTVHWDQATAAAAPFTGIRLRQRGGDRSLEATAAHIKPR
jgi:hypothetical protein